MDKHYFGCRVDQRTGADTPSFFVFVVRAKDLNQWAGTQRTEEIVKGIQRVLRPTRVRAISRFLASDPKNTIPNSVLVAFEPGTVTFQPSESEGAQIPENGCEGTLSWGTITFSFDPAAPEHERPALIVDGQHRINGIASFPDEDLPILVVAMLNAESQEQAFQFMVVNSKAVKVPTENVKAIIAEFDEDALEERLLKAGIRYGNVSPKLREINDLSISPFRNLLDWPANREGTKLVSVLTIEQGFRYLESAFGVAFENDEDSEIEVFCAIWNGVKNKYSDLWGHENKLMAKVSLTAINEFLVSRLKVLWSVDSLDILNSEEVAARSEKLLVSVPSEYWTIDWRVPLQDTSGFKQFVREDLERMSENHKLKKTWHEELQLPLFNE